MCKIPEEKVQKSDASLLTGGFLTPTSCIKVKNELTAVLEGSVYWIIEKTAGHYATAVFWENVFL